MVRGLWSLFPPIPIVVFQNGHSVDGKPSSLEPLRCHTGMKNAALVFVNSWNTIWLNSFIMVKIIIPPRKIGKKMNILDLCKPTQKPY